MAEVQKKDPYKMLFDALAMSGLTDDDLKTHFPKTMAWWESGASEEDRRKAMNSLMGDPQFQKELRQWDDFSDYDFSGYEKPKEPTVKPGNLSGADMKDVEKFYKKAKQVIDPHGRLGDTELYDTAGPGTFEQLEEKIGPDHEGDWFGNLLGAFGYQDTPEGYEQLTQDFQTALTRMKNKNAGEKYGAMKTPLKFLFKKSFDALEDGKKPGLADIAIDTGTNLAMMLPAGEMIPIASKTVGRLPRATRAAEFVMKGNAPKEILGKVLKTAGTAAAVPTGSELFDYAFGTDTEKEKQEGIQGRAATAGTGTLVNLATPGLLKMIPMRGGSILGNFSLKPQEAARLNRKIADFIDFGSRKNAATQKLGMIADDLAESKQIVMDFARKFSKNRKPSAEELGKFAAGFRGRLEDKADALSKAIYENKSLGKGVQSFLNSGRDKVGEFKLKEIAESVTPAWEEALPYLSSYFVNRMGRDGVAKFVKNMFGRYTNRFSDEEK